MDLKINALNARYQAQRLEAIATLEVYLKSPAGIGEHPQIIDEMDKLIRQIADADGCLDVLKSVVVSNPESGTGDQINS